MAIVSSIAIVDSHSQKDGRIYVRELHTDSIGNVYPIEYLAENGADINSVANARGVRLSDDLAEAEALALMNGT